MFVFYIVVLLFNIKHVKTNSHVFSLLSFQCIPVGSEYDMRFLYCACAISHILIDWSGVNVERAVSFIKSCRSFDGAIPLIPHQEGHGGSTFCGVACLKKNKIGDAK